ncbi:hypothetical protein [Pimelobacter simplex]|uniref:hypothetical protein n=1 Tax=Nocardioides simplex TaxID=2045 RepID=UPI00214FFCD0|nr:hypothetical protein [Pimelobacter simplex]UUW88404.1 hypothetical protein M0M43_22030 [Pimelobacter simplex]UUW97908.1 hypothetical protein M0M48_10675 [Pimelobacter simplex]
MAQFDRLGPRERDLWILDNQRQRTTCPDCGNPIAECSDPDRSWYSYRRICYASMEVRAAEDAYADLHEKAPYHDGTFTSWNTKRTTEFPFHHSHGVNFGVAREDLTPWDTFTTERDASPIPPSPGGQPEAGAGG